MAWQPERNRFSLSPHGIKEAEGHAARAVHDANCVPGPDMPPGILGAPLNSDPHGRGPKANPNASPSSHRPVGAPAEIKPPHNQGPHDHLDPRRR
jgi:hypothetical protein